MNYSDFFQKFYFSRSSGGLIGYKSQVKIPEFFFKNALQPDYHEKLPTSNSSYEQYFKSGRNPNSSIWEALNNHFDADTLLKNLLHELNESTLKELLTRFEVSLEITEVPDKRQFANAIVSQFKAIAAGTGSAENLVPQEYKKPPESAGFETYLRGAKNKYKCMILPGENEHLLSEFYVINNIGTSSAVFPHRIRGNYIKDATLAKIRKYDRRGEMRRVFLIGPCGYGKTLMMQHLFIEAAEHRNETGMLPIFAELRNFTPDYNDFVTFLVETVREFDLSFTYDAAIDLLEKGQIQVLLDGLDEMDPQETKHFQKKLAELCQRYPDNQIVLSSRQCSAINGIRSFNKLYIHPLDDDQSQLLIDKLLNGIDDEEAKTTVLSFMEPSSGFIKKNGFVATNPMLLTIMVRNYDKLRDVNGSRIRFYEIMYNALIKEHDEDKESFDRFFHSVGSSDEFTEVFREFCTLAYMDGVFEFDHRSFEKYFKQLKSKEKLQNPSIFSISNFQHDVCATACMMYEQESGIYYIDPGFQDYFFAEYYYQEDADSTKLMGRALWDRGIDSFRNLNALKMLYEIASEKVEVCVILPYLDSIFKGKTEPEAFLRYLSYGYGEITYILLDKPRIDEYIQKRKDAKVFDYIPEVNSVQNIVMGFLQEALAVPNSFIVGAFDEAINSTGATHFITGFYERSNDDEEARHKGDVYLKGLQFEIEYIHDQQYLQDLEFTPFPVIDNNGYAALFGYVYKVDPLTVLESPNQLKDLLEVCHSSAVQSTYERVKEYYAELLKKQKKNAYR